MKSIVLATAVVVCVATLAKSAAIYGAQSSRPKEDLLADDAAGDPWWFTVIVAKRNSGPDAASPTEKKHYYYVPTQRQVTSRLVFLYSVLQIRFCQIYV